MRQGDAGAVRGGQDREHGWRSRLAALAVPLLAISAWPASVLAGDSVSPCDYMSASYTMREFPMDLGNTNQDNWSPDGNRMVFTEGGEVKVFDLERWRTSATLTENVGAAAPTWTDDGTIFYEVPQAANDLPLPGGDPGPPDLWVMNEDGTSARQVEFPDGLPPGPPNLYRSSAGAIRITRDGTLAALNAVIGPPEGERARTAPAGPSHWKVVVMDVVYEGDRVRLANPRLVADEPYFNEVKGWSSDNRLQVASTRGGPESLNTELYLLSLDGTWERLTTNDAWDEVFDVNAGGNVAFMSDRATSGWYEGASVAQGALPHDLDGLTVAGAVPVLAGGGAHELFVAGPQGDRGPVRRLTFGFDEAGRHIVHPKWSPDGTRIRFTDLPPRAETWRRAVARREPPKPDSARYSMLLTFDCADEDTTGPRRAGRPAVRIRYSHLRTAGARPGRVRARLVGREVPEISRATFYLGRRLVDRDRRAPFVVTLRYCESRARTLRAVVRLSDGRRATLRRDLPHCAV